jgi:excisionase family DNA binding protein
VERTNEKLGSPLELAAYLDVPLKTIYQWKYTGKGPRAIRVGRHLRYRWEDVESWLDKQRDDRA